MKLVTYNPFRFLYDIFLAEPTILVILFDATMLEKNHDLAKAAALKVIDELNRNKDIVIDNYILIPFDQGFLLIYYFLSNIFSNIHFI